MEWAGRWVLEQDRAPCAATRNRHTPEPKWTGDKNGRAEGGHAHKGDGTRMERGKNIEGLDAATCATRTRIDRDKNRVGRGGVHLRHEAHGEERGWVMAPGWVQSAEEVGATGISHAALQPDTELQGLRRKGGGGGGRGVCEEEMKEQ